MAAANGCEVSLPSSSIGYLIGKLGVTVQELQKLTDCHISIPRRKDGEEKELTSIRIRCIVARSPNEKERREARCIRIAQLLCLEGHSLVEACTQADREQKTHEMVEAACLKQQEERMAIDRILINWPDFYEQDVRAALHKTYDDEDQAIDLLLAGFCAPPALPTFEVSTLSTTQKHQRKKVQEKKEQKKEQYPSLGLQTFMDVKHNSIILGSTRGSWSINRVASGANAAPENTTNNFPSLPIAAPPRPANGDMRNPSKGLRGRNLGVPPHNRRVRK